jgi:hypothetical protein
MSTSTQGIVVTDNKDVKEIATRVRKVIVKVPCERINNGHTNPNAFPEIQYDPISNFLRFFFKDGELKRILWVFLECDCDNLKLGEKSISFSFGDFGNSVEIMKNVLNEFKDMGTCYIHECDAVGEPVEFK